MNQKHIVIDGKVYNSVDEMPPDVRRLYEEARSSFNRERNQSPDLPGNTNPFADKNNDGLPDVLSNMASFQAGSMMSAAKIVFNGQTYDSMEQLPPEVRARYQQALGAMDANGNGIPDFVEGMTNMPNQMTANTPIRVEMSAPPRSTPTPVSSTIEPESSGKWLWITLGVLFVGACLVAVAAGAWYFFLR